MARDSRIFTAPGSQPPKDLEWRKSDLHSVVLKLVESSQVCDGRFGENQMFSLSIRRVVHFRAVKEGRSM